MEIFILNVWILVAGLANTFNIYNLHLCKDQEKQYLYINFWLLFFLINLKQ